MSKEAGKTLAAIPWVATIGATLSFGTGITLAEEKVKNFTEDQILRALIPAMKSPQRGLSIGPQRVEAAAAPAENPLIQKVRGRATHSLSISEREEIATLIKDKPNIDLEIQFEYKSARINSRSLPSIQALGRALSNSELKGSTFVVAGHTDAVGGEDYNLDLSERRADAIKRYLVDKFGISGSDLISVGYGKTKLKDPARPQAEVNRRVQVVNMENKTTASK
jgi:outer membrane protein OmpA-like peptidoglycan-associated protein